MSPRIYTRKLDWEDAQRRHAAGESYSSIARDYDVSPVTVALACDEEQRRKYAERSKKYSAIGTNSCEDCGAPITRYATVCQTCRGLRDAITVREDTLQCVSCKEWKPDEEFPRNRELKGARRGRHRQCRPCSTKARRDYRRRNREKENAYSREYKRRRKSSK
jgi:hypothetical protein